MEDLRKATGRQGQVIEGNPKRVESAMQRGVASEFPVKDTVGQKGRWQEEKIHMKLGKKSSTHPEIGNCLIHMGWRSDGPRESVVTAESARSICGECKRWGGGECVRGLRP